MCGLVLDALQAIGQTCELDIGDNPLKRDGQNYLKPLELQLAAYRREDPPPIPQLAAPVTLVNKVVDQLTGPGTTPKQHATADLCLIAFYYLLRVGEYTHPRKQGATRTIQFRFQT